jgi:malate dehydrogenase (oxaloacetate-decarboxylating)
MTNPTNYRGDLAGALKGAHLFLGLSGPDTVRPEWLAKMAKGAMVFAMANPTPEIAPELVPKNVSVVATGRSDYPNQINNVLCFPGLFKGAFSVRAREINEQMTLAAARAIAAIVTRDELSVEQIVPSVFDRRVAPAVAAAVAEAAIKTHVARRSATASKAAAGDIVP